MIKNTLLGGTDWTNGTVLDADDLNDTFDATYDQLRGTVKYDEYNDDTEYSQSDGMTTKITRVLTVNSSKALITGVSLNFETKNQTNGAPVDILIRITWTDEAGDSRTRFAVCQTGNQYNAIGGAIYYNATESNSYTQYHRFASFGTAQVTNLASTINDNKNAGYTLTTGATEYTIEVMIAGNSPSSAAFIRNTTMRVYWEEATEQAGALAAP